MLYQHKKGSILLKVNGKRIVGRKIQALNICYFYMTYQVKKENVQIKYCQTDKMWEDLMTNPTQREKFRNLINY